MDEYCGSSSGNLAHKMRAVLTMLGICIGIASIIAIVSTIKGTSEQIKEQLLGSRHTVEVKLNQGDSEYDPGVESEGVKTPILTEDIKEFVRALESVEKATFFTAGLRLMMCIMKKGP